jgi:hypothetical protein
VGNFRETSILENQGVDGRIIFKLILKEGSSGPDNEMIASQEKLCSVELVV